ncbi:MAG: PHB depolymerase family esterase [Pseudomonadota bacterium]
MYLFLEEMNKASELTRAGRLQEATQLIQRALGKAEADGTPTQAASGNSSDQVIDVVAREVVDEPPVRPAGRAASAAPPAPAPLAAASFERHQYESGGKPYSYWLYKPGGGDDPAPMPVVVMLHGCTQDGADFASGTSMNALAEHRNCLVVYPEQRQDANSMRCWNWFEPAHQKRGSGEPAMIAGLALEVAAVHHGDTSRIYVSGLSAGGAMATLVGQLYPDVFAAVGVHSGLPAESARDVVSAMAMMRKPGAKGASSGSPRPAVPTIVFHGSADRTVHPANGKRIVLDAVSAIAAAGTVLEARPGAASQSSRTVRRTVHASADGKAWVESWEIAGAAHAWAGGHASGSYTDPQGPDASAAILDFFLAHRRAT